MPATKSTPVLNFIPVISSQISEWAYDPKAKVLAVRFTGGGEYHYYGVILRVWHELNRADSRGSAFHKLIKNTKIPFTKKV